MIILPIIFFKTKANNKCFIYLEAYWVRAVISPRWGDTTSRSRVCLDNSRDFFITEIRELNTYNMQYFPQHVLLCTSAVHDQSWDVCIQEYLRIIWIGNVKSLKIDNIHKRYVLFLKLEYYFKSCKLNPRMQYKLSQKK